MQTIIDLVFMNNLSDVNLIFQKAVKILPVSNFATALFPRAADIALGTKTIFLKLNQKLLHRF